MNKSLSLSNCPDYYVKYFESRPQSGESGGTWIITFFVINVISSFLAAVANGLIVAAIFKTHSRRNPSLLMLANMALTDLAVGLFGQPLFAVLMYAISTEHLNMFCKMLYPTRFLTGTLCPASFLTITLISLDRWLAIRLKISYRARVTNTRVVSALVLIWGISLIGGITFNTLDYGEMVNVFTVGVLLCLAVILYSYIQAFRALKSHCKQLQIQQGQQNIVLKGIMDVKKYRTMLKTMALIITLMVLFYTPIAVSMLTFKLQGINQNSLVLFYIASTLALVNSSLNPAIYIWKIEDIRRACFHLTRRILCRENRVIVLRLDLASTVSRNTERS